MENRDDMIARYGSDRWGFEGLDGNSLRTSSSCNRDGRHGPLDQIAWFHNKSGCYYSKSGRNSALFYEKEEDARLIWERAHTLGDDFRIFNLSHVEMKPRPPRSQRWVKPPIDVIKINVDAGIHDTVVGIGIFVRDSDVFVLGGCMVYLDYKMDVQWAEEKGLREGIVWANNNNVERAIFETDCTGMVNRFKLHREDISIFGFRLKNIFNLLDSSIKFVID
ncbi:hypothetical protein Gorai_006275 [Gossypium raimondii]|uniref:RNase H type-1 domain-containing protein n=1 Tax=Gossypium raimondii TaxID=29730 RepID=A0A7J8QFN4_GOSRA|nr:hypothetical protein [Gossypium raimondii]